MKARIAYPLVFLLPSAMAAFLSAFVAAGVGAGILWLFVYGDDAWPKVAGNAVMVLAAVVAACALAMLLSASYAFGKRRETSGGLAGRHIAFAAAISVLVPALALLHQWRVGNLWAG